MKAASTIVQRGNTVLLLRRGPTAPHRPNQWNFPGGHLKDGETALETAKREVREETGLKVLGIRRVVTLDLPVAEVTYYHTTYFEGEPRIDYESSDWKWVPVDEVKDYDTVPGTNRALAASQQIRDVA